MHVVPVLLLVRRVRDQYEPFVLKPIHQHVVYDAALSIEEKGIMTLANGE